MGALKLEDLPQHTYSDYKQWDTQKWKLIYGIAHAISPAPMIEHQKISNNIAWELKNIFEVLSKSTAKKDTGLKFDLYEKEGGATKAFEFSKIW